MKKIFTLFLVLITTTSLWAYDFKVGDLCYNITSNTKPYTVEVDDATSSITTASIPESVTYNDTTYSVTSIGLQAFYGCSSLTSVTIPNSVTSIGHFAFRDCSSLTSVTIPNSVTSIGHFAFHNCSGLTSLTIPNSVTSIGDDAFSRCSGLTSLTIPESVTSIGDRAFSDCTSVIWNAKNCADIMPRYGSPFSDIVDITFGNKVEHIPAYLCYGLGKLTTVTISASVTSIGDHAFNSAYITSIICKATTPPTIEANTFSNVSKSTSIHVPCGCETKYQVAYGWQDFTNIQEIDYHINVSANSQMGSAKVDYNTACDGNQISAEANYGYHFVQWSDGNTDNPRSLTLTQDTILTAEFAINTYEVTIVAENGATSGAGTYNHGTTITLTATPYEGYHFVKWSDGSTDNPRTIVVMKNISLTAQCIINTYDVTITAENGVISGTGTYNHGTTVRLAAIPNIGYHFVQWSDGNTDNPRSLVLTQDTTLTAEFAINTYTLTIKSNGNGNVTGNGTYNHGENVIISATADIGYHFVRWNDGNTENPRTLILTQDTIFTAEFAQTVSGQCGDNLYWAYNESDQSIAITGTGDMYNYTSGTQPWILFLEKIKKVTTDNTAASLGTSAFEGAIRLAEVHIGAKIDMIEANVFAGCNRLRNIYCYPTYPPIIRESSFARYDALLYIPCDYLEDYVFDNNWKRFENIQCAGAEKEEIESDGVDVDPSSTSVTMTWPTEENANTYTIEIMKGGALFCRLVFNTTGQLLNISFAPSRDGNNRPAQYAELVANGSGLRFTVTGLNERTHYTYDLRAKDKDENTIQSHSGEFTTKSNVTTDMDNIQSPVTTCQKVMRNGQLVILRDGKEYNAMGAEIQ